MIRWFILFNLFKWGKCIWKPDVAAQLSWNLWTSTSIHCFFSRGDFISVYIECFFLNFFSFLSEFKLKKNKICFGHLRFSLCPFATSRTDWSPGVDFINVLCTAFTCVVPKSVKRFTTSLSIFTLLCSTHVKAVRWTLVKLTPDAYKHK